MPSNSSETNGGGRREFLKKAAVLPAVVAAAGHAGDSALAAPAAKTAQGRDKDKDKDKKLPQIRLGKYSLSRLICGNNTFTGGSHLSVFVNREMRRYFTQEQIFKTLRRCCDAGINCWQGSGTKALDLYRRFACDLNSPDSQKTHVMTRKPALATTDRCRYDGVNGPNRTTRHTGPPRQAS